MTSGESTYTLELPYRRSVGPVVGAFLTGLRDQQVLGSRTSGGRVVALDYKVHVSPLAERFGDQLRDGQIVGSRCPQCGLVYVPTRAFCPMCTVAMGTGDETPLPDRGTVTSFTILTPIQYHGQKEREDYALASVLIDGADGTVGQQRLTDISLDKIRMGMRVEAVWAPEGVMMPELYLADALGAAGKPIMRVHTAGSVGGSTAIVATHLVESSVRQRVLTLAFEKQSEGDTTWALGGGRSGGVGAGGYFAPHIRAYIARSNAPEYVGWMVAVKDRKNALKNPYAHLKVPDIDLEMVRDSPMVWDPVRRLESCPASDGACAMVLTDEAGGDASSKPPAWVHGTAVRSELGQFPGRDPVNPRGARTARPTCTARPG